MFGLTKGQLAVVTAVTTSDETYQVKSSENGAYNIRGLAIVERLIELVRVHSAVP
jgi:hypothetical protein